jgi:hypothetical protein
MNGHKFVQKQFYQIILCAFCSEFLLNAVGYQCEDCRYTCHKKCYEKVLTKCISKSSSDGVSRLFPFALPTLTLLQDGDEEKINHRIPHRFAPVTNLSANWCCHCGYMLPLGRKNARRCTECSITCHASCAHLVPDFCGMPMETANMLLYQWREINRVKAKPRITAADTPQQQMDDLGATLDQVHIRPGGGRMSYDNVRPDDPYRTTDQGQYGGDRRQQSLDYTSQQPYALTAPDKIVPPYGDGKPSWSNDPTKVRRSQLL